MHAPLEKMSASAETRSKSKDAESLRIWKYKLTEVISVLGFCLALFSSIYAFTQIFGAHDVRLFIPQQVEIRCHPVTSATNACSDSSNLIITGTAMSYINHGPRDKNAMIMHEAVDVDYMGRTFRLDWHWFSNIGEEGKNQTVAAPFVVPGGLGGLSHETQFVGRVVPAAEGELVYANRYPWSRFLEGIVNDEAGARELELRFEAKVYGDTDREGRCRVVIDDLAVQRWKDHGSRWFAHTFPCMPVEPALRTTSSVPSPAGNP